MGEDGKQDKIEKPQSIKLEVELHQDGQLSVKCPMLGDTLFMCGLCETIKATAFQYKANQSKIVQPKGGIMNFIKSGKRF